MSGAIPFEAIAAAALAQAGLLLRDWFPCGKVVGREFKVGSLQGDPGDSLSINLATGRGADFATGEGWPDLIGVRAALSHRGDRVAAARELGTMLGISMNGQSGAAHAKPNGHAGPQRDDWQPIVPPPSDAPRPDPRLFLGYSAIHEYCTPDDRILFYMRRREATPTERKQFHPLVYGTLNGKPGWHAKDLPGLRPLFGLNRLSTMPAAPVLLCEGEKSADAAQRLFPDHACISWMGGTGRVQHADLSPLASRSVLIWPDNDAAGLKAAEFLRTKLHAPVLRVDDLPDGHDAADIHPADPDAWLRDHLPPDESDGSEPALAAFLSAEEWLKRDFPEPESLLGDLIVSGVRMFIVGRTGLGKTMLGFAFAVAVASGTLFLHWKSGRPARVLYVDGEMPGALIQQRLRDALRRPEAIDLGGRLTIFARDLEDTIADRFPSLGPFQPLNTEAGRNWLLAFIKAIGGVDLIVFDNVMSLLDGVQKEEESWSGALPLVDKLSRQRIAQLWLDHTGHNTDRQYGTSTKSWRFDAVGIMTALPDDQRQRGELAFTLSFEPPGKARRRTPQNCQDFETCIIRLRDDRWTSEPAARPDTKATGNVSPSRKPFYDALTAAITKSTVGPGRTTIETWQLECLRRSLIEKPPADGAKETATQRDSRYRLFRTAKAALIAAKWIAVDDDMVSDLKGRWA